MKVNLLAASVAATLVAGLAFTGVAQAGVTTLLIDDWNLDTGTNLTGDVVGTVATQSRATSLPVGTGLPRLNLGLGITTGGGTVGAEVADCATCDFGTFSNNVGTAGYAYWSWSVTAGSLSPFTDISMKYFSDLADADIIFSLFNGGSSVAGSLVQWSDLAATGGPSTATTISSALPDLSSLTYNELRIYAFSAGGSLAVPDLGTVNVGAANADGIDMGFKTLEVTYQTPEPSSLALVGLTLAGLGFMRRRRS